MDRHAQARPVFLRRIVAPGFFDTDLPRALGHCYLRTMGSEQLNLTNFPIPVCEQCNAEMRLAYVRPDPFDAKLEDRGFECPLCKATDRVRLERSNHVQRDTPESAA